MTIAVRKAQPNDSHFIYELYEADGALAEFPTLFADVSQEVNDTNRIVWIALDGDTCVGTVALVLDYWQKDLANGESIAMVKRLRVMKKYEGKGVATLLNQQLEAEARNNKFGMLSIEVHEANSHAKLIYKHWGYELLRLGYRMGELAMTKEL